LSIGVLHLRGGGGVENWGFDRQQPQKETGDSL